MDFNLILELIKKYDNITIFRHQRADGDAAGSQLGLKEWILSNFPNKKVYVLGEDTYDLYPYFDIVEDDIIKNSLAIILDTSNRERIDDDRWQLSLKTIKIDHHPVVDNYANYNYVNVNAGACCEYLVHILNSFNMSFTKEAAKYFYSGILTDTMNFTTSQTSSDTLLAASILAKTGISLYDINSYLFDLDMKIFNFRTYLRTRINFKDGLAYIIFDEEDYNKFNISDSIARFQISELAGVKDYKIWAIFTKNSEGTYDGSLRSKKEFIINNIASKYNGGGHANACGVKQLTKENLSEIINELLELISLVKC